MTMVSSQASPPGRWVGYAGAASGSDRPVKGCGDAAAGDGLPPIQAAVDSGRWSVGLEACRIVELPKIADPRGNLTFIESARHVPFEIRRVYYLYDVPGGAERGGHAHRALHQLIIAMSGSFDIVVDDGREKGRFHLNRSYYGLYVPPMIWREIDNFSSGSVCLVLASTLYDPDDYHRDYEEFVAAARDLK